MEYLEFMFYCTIGLAVFSMAAGAWALLR